MFCFPQTKPTLKLICVTASASFSFRFPFLVERLRVRVGVDPDLHLHRPLVHHLPPLQFQSTASRAKKAIVINLVHFARISAARCHSDGHQAQLRAQGGDTLSPTAPTPGATSTPRSTSRSSSSSYFAPFLFMSFFYYQIVKVLWNKNIPGSAEVNSRPIRTGQWTSRLFFSKIPLLSIDINEALIPW
ncbi:hypothetical protein CEXT_140581 [Caerostris extrusa]|uniref:Uncharacterized protein n=1 Tax=Caerostris extrusa TaxID=172846 RepID=A0AAV4MRH9_CAEEX|nr:hypothetical protein CEXT_140581 [Caerostris extrusa]